MKVITCPTYPLSLIRQVFKPLFAALAGLAFLLFLASPAFASFPVPVDPCSGDCVPTTIGCLPKDAGQLAVCIMDRGMKVAFFAAAILIVMSGYQLATSTGDPLHVREAKTRLTAAIAGLIFILLAEVLINIIYGGILKQTPVS